MEKMIWSQTVSETIASVATDHAKGLSQKEAKERLVTNGLNQLPGRDEVNWWQLLFRQFASVLIWLLLLAAAVAGFLGERLDMWAILVIVIFNAILGFFQEFRAEKSMQALNKLISQTAKVIREGVLQEVPSTEVVVGDLVLIEAGDRVPADGRVINSSYLMLNESSLTGESLPVAKQIDPLEGNRPVAERKNMVFLGTSVASGKGTVVITQTARDTQMGEIAKDLKSQVKEETPLQRQLAKLGKKLALLCLVIIVIVFGLGLLRGVGVIEMLLVAISLAVAAIPEGLPAAVTIALSIGVKKMAKNRALVRRLSSVETLGCTNVICTDKTGTLTKNAMTVKKIWIDQACVEVEGAGYIPEGGFSKEPQDLEFALILGALCNNAGLIQKQGMWQIVGDPTEGALLTLAGKGDVWPESLANDYEKIEELPFDSARKRMSVLCKGKEGSFLITKGALDQLLPKCSKQLVNGEEVLLDDSARGAIVAQNEAFGNEAFRSLAIAYRKGASTIEEEDLVFVAIFAMMDPPRPEVKHALQQCKEAGIATVMVTGDHKNTALSIARELGWENLETIEGTQIETVAQDQVVHYGIFSRISPSDKLKIIDAHKKHGHVTAMTGDGVNDASAVMAADIGVSMGITGTDVTKESADMILLDDHFETIVKAVKEGRGIYDNIVKFVSYLLSSNLAEILVIFIAMLIGLKDSDGTAFVALLPIQLLWINLVTDGFPAISLALDPVDPRAMKRPPRAKEQPILHKRFSMFILAISILVTAGAFASLFYGLTTSVEMAQTMTFTTLIVLELVRVQMIRKQYRMKLFSNPWLLIALASSFCLQLAVIYVPSLQPIFKTVALPLREWGVIFGVSALVYFIGMGLTKVFQSDP